MKLQKIIENNKILSNLRSFGKQFEYDLGKTLLINLEVTNKLINSQNIKLNNLVTEYGELEGYDYVIKDPEKKEAYTAAFQAILDQDIDVVSLGYKHLTERNLRDSKFDLDTLAMISALIEQN